MGKTEDHPVSRHDRNRERQDHIQQPMKPEKFRNAGPGRAVGYAGSSSRNTDTVYGRNINLSSSNSNRNGHDSFNRSHNYQSSSTDRSRHANTSRYGYEGGSGRNSSYSSAPAPDVKPDVSTMVARTFISATEPAHSSNGGYQYLSSDWMKNLPRQPQPEERHDDRLIPRRTKAEKRAKYDYSHPDKRRVRGSDSAYRPPNPQRTDELSNEVVNHAFVQPYGGMQPLNANMDPDDLRETETLKLRYNEIQKELADLEGSEVQPTFGQFNFIPKPDHYTIQASNQSGRSRDRGGQPTFGQLNITPKPDPDAILPSNQSDRSRDRDGHRFSSDRHHHSYHLTSDVPAPINPSLLFSVAPLDAAFISQQQRMSLELLRKQEELERKERELERKERMLQNRGDPGPQVLFPSARRGDSRTANDRFDSGSSCRGERRGGGVGKDREEGYRRGNSRDYSPPRRGSSDASRRGGDDLPRRRPLHDSHHSQHHHNDSRSAGGSRGHGDSTSPSRKRRPLPAPRLSEDSLRRWKKPRAEDISDDDESATARKGLQNGLEPVSDNECSDGKGRSMRSKSKSRKTRAIVPHVAPIEKASRRAVMLCQRELLPNEMRDSVDEQIKKSSGKTTVPNIDENSKIRYVSGDCEKEDIIDIIESCFVDSELHEEESEDEGAVGAVENGSSAPTGAAASTNPAVPVVSAATARSKKIEPAVEDPKIAKEKEARLQAELNSDFSEIVRIGEYNRVCGAAHEKNRLMRRAVRMAEAREKRAAAYARTHDTGVRKRSRFPVGPIPCITLDEDDDDVVVLEKRTESIATDSTAHQKENLTIATDNTAPPKTIAMDDRAGRVTVTIATDNTATVTVPVVTPILTFLERPGIEQQSGADPADLSDSDDQSSDYVNLPPPSNCTSDPPDDISTASEQVDESVSATRDTTATSLASSVKEEVAIYSDGMCAISSNASVTPEMDGISDISDTELAETMEDIKPDPAAIMADVEKCTSVVHKSEDSANVSIDPSSSTSCDLSVERDGIDGEVVAPDANFAPCDISTDVVETSGAVGDVIDSDKSTIAALISELLPKVTEEEEEEHVH